MVSKSEDDFIKTDKERGVVTVVVNPEVFPIDLVYNAAYMLMDRSYIMLDGSPSDKIYVIMKPRTYKGELIELGRMFYDELVASAFHAVQFVRNKEMREALLNSMVPASEEACEVEPQGEPEEEFDEKDIATIWEEKFGASDETSLKNKQ